MQNQYFWSLRGNEPKMAYSRNLLKMAIMDCQGLSRTVKKGTRTIKDCCRLSWTVTIKDCQGLSWTVTIKDCQGLSRSIKDCQGL